MCIFEDLGLADAGEVARPGRPDGRLQQVLAGGQLWRRHRPATAAHLSPPCEMVAEAGPLIQHGPNQSGSQRAYTRSECAVDA